MVNTFATEPMTGSADISMAKASFVFKPTVKHKKNAAAAVAIHLVNFVTL
jgi:hypothetical protein